jgi:uncharacterized protein
MSDCTTSRIPSLEETIRSILTAYRRIAVVGLSDRRSRDSNRVAAYMLGKGYTIIPVNPEVSRALGLTSYADLLSVPGPIEVVNIFRRREHLAGIVDQAIVVGAKAIWMQSGLRDDASAEKARTAGMRVVMNRCIMVEHSRYFGW